MSDVKAVLDEALGLGDEGRWEEMAELLVGALSESPDDPYLLCWAGVAERESGNNNAAYDLFKRCLAEEPTDAHLLALAGSGLAAFDDPAAENALRAAALTAPTLATARIQYGAFLARAGLFDEALEHLAAGTTLAPDDPVAHGEYGVALALKGDLAGAVRCMETALELEPADSWTRVLLGLILIESGQHVEAAEALLEAAGQRTDDGEAQIVAALAASAAGWVDAAESALAHAEYGVGGADVQLLGEASDAIAAGEDAARTLLLDDVAPSVLHDRLMQPL